MAVAAERKEVQALIELGKKKGHLTVDDINALLPPEVSTPDQIRSSGNRSRQLSIT